MHKDTGRFETKTKIVTQHGNILKVMEMMKIQ